MSEHPYLIKHDSGDEAEADTMAAARLAAETLLIDNNGGSVTVMKGLRQMGAFRCGVRKDDGTISAIGGWWRLDEEKEEK